MNSRITIEVDYEDNNNPVIQILSRESSDVRDGLIKSFLENLGHTSRWGKIIYKGPLGEGHRWHVIPVKIGQLEVESKLMAGAIEHQQSVGPRSDRRFNKQTMHPAELAILEAQYEVEKVGADKRLTDATMLLDQAKNLVGDYIDEFAKK